MGFRFREYSKLHCDKCDCSGGVRKRPCPFGWCPPCALCPACYREIRSTGGFSKQTHGGCAMQQAAFRLEKIREQELLNEGRAVRCSALSVEGGRVQVLFRLKDGTTIGRFMSGECYNAIPLMKVATPEDYEALGIGEIDIAPGEYQWGTTKRVA